MRMYSKAWCAKNCSKPFAQCISARSGSIRTWPSELASHLGEEPLSEREIEVLQLVAAGNSNKEIGARLFITEQTAKAHLKRIIAKLGANDRTHAVTLAMNRGFLVGDSLEGVARKLLFRGSHARALPRRLAESPCNVYSPRFQMAGRDVACCFCA